jgi:hypothetical protein
MHKLAMTLCLDVSLSAQWPTHATQNVPGTPDTQERHISAPKIWDNRALEDRATAIAALGVRPGRNTFTSSGPGFGIVDLDTGRFLVKGTNT